MMEERLGNSKLSEKQALYYKKKKLAGIFRNLKNGMENCPDEAI